MNRRELGKGVLSFFAGLTCSIPFVKGKERGPVTGIVDTIEYRKVVKAHQENTLVNAAYFRGRKDGYEQCTEERLNAKTGKQITIIKWTSVEDELPEDKSTSHYLIRYANGIITTIDGSAVSWFFTNLRRNKDHNVADWAHLPKV